MLHEIKHVFKHISCHGHSWLLYAHEHDINNECEPLTPLQLPHPNTDHNPAHTKAEFIERISLHAYLLVVKVGY